MVVKLHPDRSLGIRVYLSTFHGRTPCALTLLFCVDGLENLWLGFRKALLWLNEGIFGSWSQVSRPLPRRLEIVVFRLQCRTVFIFLGLCLNIRIWLNLDIFVWAQSAEFINHLRITRKQDDGAMTFRAVWNVSGLVSGNGLGSVSKIWIFNDDISRVYQTKVFCVHTFQKIKTLHFSSSSFLNASQYIHSTIFYHACIFYRRTSFDYFR
jgi:hypothetical protein